MTSEKYVPRLKEAESKIVDDLMKKFNYKNRFEAPRMTKIVISTAYNAAKEDTKFLDEAMNQIARIAGQQPVRTVSRRAVSNFKIKKNQPVGCKVTLRRERMYEFLDRFINIAIPRMRDFRGLDKKSFDRDGNYNVGVPDITIFPEAQPGKISRPIGIGITICVRARNTEEGMTYLGMLGVPFRR